MFKFQRILCMILVIVAVFTMVVGCSGDSKKNTGTVKNSTQVTEKESTAPVTIKMFANFATVDENEFSAKFIEKLEKENNVKLELEIPPAANYKERLQLMVVSGTYPDVVNFASHTDDILRNSSGGEGIFIAINKYLKDAPNIMKYTYPETWDATKVKQDNDIYMIPRTSILRNDGFILRKDWLDNVGLKLPENGVVSLDEFTEILKRFTENDPDKNGKKDTYGFTPIPSSDGTLFTQADQAFGLVGWQEFNEGSYKYMNLQYSKKMDNYKKALEYSASLWKKGYINIDWPLLKANGNIDSLTKGQSGLINGFAGHVQLRQDTAQKSNPNAKMTYICGVKGKDGKFTGTTSNPGIWGGWAITKVAKNPEKIVKMFDWMLSDSVWDMVKYGPEGLAYKVENGKKVPTDKYTTLKQNSWPGNIVRRNNDPSFFIELTVSDEEKANLEKWLDVAIKNVVVSKDRGFKPEITKDPGYIEAEKRRNQTVAKIILGDQPVDAYDKALDDWYKNGGETYVKQMNEYIMKIEGK